MTFFSTRISAKVTRSFSFVSLTSRGAFFLLFAAIAATSFQGSSSSSIFAFAKRKGRNKCKDKNRMMVEKKMNGVVQTLPYCEWVADNPETRCKRREKRPHIPVVKYTIKKKGKIKSGKRRVKSWQMCGCTCADYVEVPTPEVKTCPMSLTFDTSYDVLSTEQDNVSRKPVEVDPMLIVGQPCVNKGFAQGAKCDYGHTWNGCTYEDLECQPANKCTCSGEFADDSDEWNCSVFSYITCPLPPRPTLDNPNPVYLVPPESGSSCKPGDPKPMEQESSGEISLLGIRRSLR